MKTILTSIFFFVFLNLNAQRDLIQEKIHQLYFQGKGLELDYTLFPFNTIEIENDIFHNRWESAGLNLSIFI